MLFIREVNVNGKPLDTNKTTDYTKDDEQQDKKTDPNEENPVDKLRPVNPAGEDDPPTDYTQDQDDNDMTIPQDAAPEDDNTPPSNDESEEGQPDNEEGGESATDYTQDTGDDPQENSEGDTEEGSQEPDNEDLESTDGSTQSDDEIRQMEAEIFSNLSPEQMVIKNKELKNRYLEFYSSTIDIIERINNISKSEDISKVLEFVSDKLSELRDMVVDYIENVFSTVSYMENAINYNKYLAILSGINKIMEQLGSKQG